MKKNDIPKIRILVACHKSDPNIRHDELYMPIQVGKALHPELDLGYQTDNTRDNISEKNGSYCELTALYWAWKNLKDLDYIGLAHYRRYFGLGLKTLPFKSILSYPNYDIIKNDSLTIIKYLRDHDIILAKPYSTPFSLEVEYNYAHIKNDFKILEETINNKFPDYKEAFYNFFYKNNKLAAYNMFITRYEIFDEYCKWLFNVLQDVEKRIEISKYSDQSRVFGYMAERLLNVYVNTHNFKVKYVPIIKIDNTKSIKYWKILVNGIRNQISFWLTYSRRK